VIPGPSDGASVTPACVRLRHWWDEGLCGLDGPVAGGEMERCSAVVQDLSAFTFDPPFNAERFCAQIAAVRGRALVRVALPQLGSPQAVWAQGLHTDYVLHGRGASPLHDAHLFLHGLGHVLLEHQGAAAVAAPADLDQLLPGLDRGSARRALRRVIYTPAEETAAEAFATRMLHRTGSWTAQHPLPGADAALLARMSSVLERRMSLTR
jgi:hypothetical protein